MPVNAGKLLMISLLLLLAGCSAQVSTRSQGAQGTPSSPRPVEQLRAEPYWFDCREDADCVAEEGLCGERQPLNKNYLTQYRGFRDQLARIIECMDKPATPPVTEARCVKKRCALKRK